MTAPIQLPTITGKRSPQSSLIVVFAMEFLAVGVFTLLAGASDEAGTIVILFMVGLWLIFLVTNANVVAGLGNAIAQLSGNPTDIAVN